MKIVYTNFLFLWKNRILAKKQGNKKSIILKICYFYPLLVWIFLKRFYLFIFREGKGGKKRGRETSMCGCLSRGPHWGPEPQPRHVLWLGLEPVTLWFAAHAQSTEPHQPGILVWIFIFWETTNSSPVSNINQQQWYTLKLFSHMGKLILNILYKKM